MCSPATGILSSTAESFACLEVLGHLLLKDLFQKGRVLSFDAFADSGLDIQLHVMLNVFSRHTSQVYRLSTQPTEYKTLSAALAFYRHILPT
jgi:hypothetical protein